MEESVGDDSLLNQIKQIIENGIKVDKLLRVQSTYNSISKSEAESEIFAITCDLLQNQ
jgi:hypothetical protein